MAIKTRPKVLPLSSALEKGCDHQPTYMPNTQQMAEYWQREIEKRKRAEAKAADEPRKPGRPLSGKTRVTMLLDPEVIAKFKATGAGWQARINEALKGVKV